MNLKLTDQEHQNFKHNIKKEPEAEFLCILPSFDSANAQRGDLVQVKQENEIQSEETSKLQCKICQKAFGSIYLIRQHEKTHQKLQCKVCNKKVQLLSFEKHMKSHQNEKSERKFECKICFQKFLTNKQFWMHVSRHSKRFQCDLCGHFSAVSKYNLIVHLALHLAKGQYKCIFCQKLFDDRESFRFHSRQVHGDPKNRIRYVKADLSCKTCGKEFDNVTVRKQHEKSHDEKVQCSICDKKCKAICIARHMKLHEMNGKKFICDICGYENASKNNLKDHLEVHLNPDKGKCKICKKKFSNINYLKDHLKKNHNLNVEPSKLCCNICHVKFPNLRVLKNHKVIHELLKTCPICSKSIKARSFSGHMKLHKLKKEEKKFECKVCGKKFYIKSNLYQHMKTHNKCL